jgi:phenylacetaldehyde dehydrogenase
VCTAGSRLYVHEKLFDEVVDGVSKAAQSIVVGHGMQPDTEMGPLVSSEQFDRVTGYLKIGAEEGARTVTGGSAIPGPGYFVQPTVLVDATSDRRIIQEEIFGPVVAAMPFADIDDLAAQANDTVYGLAAGVWTRDVSKAHQLAKRIKAGTIYVNTYHIYDAALPFGGYKQSGWGREMGEEVLAAYQETKSVLIAL